MFRSILLRGASAGALTLVLVSASIAQETLPTIDVRPPRRTAAKAKPPHQTAHHVTREPLAEPPSTPAAVAGEAPGIAAEAPGSSQQGAGLGGRFTGYTVNLETPAVATKDNIPILQNPISIQVVPRQVMDDQQDISVEDAIVGNVSSVQPAPDSFYDGFTIRGIPNVSIFRNNLKQFSITHLQTANLQSIEVLKGPAAMLFGRLEPGGVVNLVLKRPLETPYFSVEEQAGSWGLTRTTVDATGPLTKDKDWLYRVNLSFKHSDSFRDFVTNQDAFLAPTVTWRPTEQFRFNFDAEYQNTIFVADADSAIPAIGDRPAPIPISRYLQDPAVTRANPSRLERGLLGFDWTYDIAKDWSLTNRFAYTEMHWAQRITDYNSVDPTSGFVTRGDWDINSPDYGFTTNLDLKGKVQTGPFEHAILVGADYYNESAPSLGVLGMTPTVGPINMYFPTYSLNSYVKPQYNFYWAYRQSWAGVYGQDMISFLDDRVHILLGGRHDWAEYGYGFSPNSFPEAIAPFNQNTGVGFQNSWDQAWSPRLGVVIQPQPWLSFYANYTRSFGATNGIPLPGSQPLPPERGLQWEGGAKAEFFDKRLTATVAYYDIFKSGIVQTVPGTQFSTPVGLVESRGAELDVAGRIDENWSLIGNYSFDLAHIVADANGPTYLGLGGQLGNWLQNVPRHAGSLWIKYDALGDWRGLSLGGGVFAVGERQGDNANDFQLPAYARIDGMVMYRLQPWVIPTSSGIKNVTLQLNVKNLANTTYYAHALNRFGTFPGAPRNFIASIRMEF